MCNCNNSIININSACVFSPIEISSKKKMSNECPSRLTEESNSSASNSNSSNKRFVIPAISINTNTNNSLHLTSSASTISALSPSLHSLSPEGRFRCQSESYFSPSSHDTSCFSLDVLTDEQQLQQHYNHRTITQQWSEDSLLFSEDEEDAMTLPQSNVDVHKKHTVERVDYYEEELNSGAAMDIVDYYDEEERSVATTLEFLEMFSQSVMMKRSDEYDSDSSESVDNKELDTNIYPSLRRTRVCITFKLRLVGMAVCLLLAIIVPVVVFLNKNDRTRQHAAGEQLSSSFFVLENNLTIAPSNLPSLYLSKIPSTQPSTNTPSNSPSNYASIIPSINPSNIPSINPTSFPSTLPSISPTLYPSNYPSHIPTRTLDPSSSMFPSQSPSHPPSNIPTTSPSYSMLPTNAPTKRNIIPFLTFPKFP